MPLLFSKYATTFVRLMVSLVRSSTTTPATSSTTRPTAIQLLRMRFIVRPPLRRAVPPHRERGPRQDSASAAASNSTPGGPARADLAADRRAAGRAAVRGTDNSRWVLAAASRADRSPDRPGYR